MAVAIANHMHIYNTVKNGYASTYNDISKCYGGIFRPKWSKNWSKIATTTIPFNSNNILYIRSYIARTVLYNLAIHRK